MQYEDAWEDRKAGMTYKEIAAKYGVTLSAVKSWASRYWSKEEVATNKKKVATSKGKVATRGGQVGNKNAEGHGAPKRNHNAVKHGLFSKYLPAETLAIVADIKEESPLDILWANIQIKFAAILRAQKLMYVESADDHLRLVANNVSVSNEGVGGPKRTVSKRETVISAMEREEKFLCAQSRAMDTLMRMIKQYDELCRGDMTTEEQRSRIAKLKAEVTPIIIEDIRNE